MVLKEKGYTGSISAEISPRETRNPTNSRKEEKTRMTNEEIQRVMEFIIKQQESFAEGMERMRRSQEMAEGRVSQLETAAIHLYNTTAELRQAQTDLTVKRTELAEAQAHTDQRLNALIDIIGQGRGGTPEV